MAVELAEALREIGVGLKVAVPANLTSSGKPGQFAYDDTYYYVYIGDGATEHEWGRIPFGGAAGAGPGPVSPPPVIGFAAGTFSLAEGNSGTTNAVLQINRTGSLGAASSVVATVSGAGANSSDFVGDAFLVQVVNFAANQATATLTVPVKGDADVEPNENFVVTLSGAVEATIGAATITVTITNDDVLVTEPAPDGGTYSAPFVSPSATPAAYPPTVRNFSLGADHKPAYSLRVFVTSDFAGTNIIHNTTLAIGAKTSAQLQAEINAALAAFGIANGTGYIVLQVNNGATSGKRSIPVLYGTAEAPAIAGSSAFNNIEGTKLAFPIASTMPAVGAFLVGQDLDVFELLGARPGSAFTLRYTEDGTEQFFRNRSFSGDGLWDVGVVFIGANGVESAVHDIDGRLIDIDTVPDTMAFVPVENAVLGQKYTSEPVAVQGVTPDQPIAFAVANGKATVNGGAEVTEGTFMLGNQIRLVGNAPGANDAGTGVVFSGSGFSFTYSINTPSTKLVWNPNDMRADRIALSLGNRRATKTAGGDASVRALYPAGAYPDRFAFAVQLVATGADGFVQAAGLATPAHPSDGYLGSSAQSFGVHGHGFVVHNNANLDTMGGILQGEIRTIFVDRPAGKVWVYLNARSAEGGEFLDGDPIAGTGGYTVANLATMIPAASFNIVGGAEQLVPVTIPVGTFTPIS